MSGIKEPALKEFGRSLKRLGGIGGLAECAMVGRSHLSQVLNGKRPGRQTWKKIMTFIHEGQVFHLKQSATWNDELEALWQRELAGRQSIKHRRKRA